jgi:hypothetical protein
MVNRTQAATNFTFKFSLFYLYFSKLKFLFSYNEVWPCGLKAPIISSPSLSFGILKPALGVAFSFGADTTFSVVEKVLIAYLFYKRLMAVIIIIIYYICGVKLIMIKAFLRSRIL